MAALGSRERLLDEATLEAEQAQTLADHDHGEAALWRELRALRLTVAAALAPPEPRADRPEIAPGWYHAELMGHRERWGHLRPVTLAGRPLVEIRVPEFTYETPDGEHTSPELVEMYSPSAIFSLSPSTETDVVDQLKERASYPF